MPRPISATLKQALLAHATNEGILPLFEATWDDGVLMGEFRIARHDVNVTSGGDTYTAIDFELLLPDEDETDLPSFSIGIAGVDQSLVGLLRQLAVPAIGTLKLAMQNDPDTVEMQVSGKIRIGSVERTSARQPGHLSIEVHPYENLAQSPYPAKRYTPGHGLLGVRQ